MVVEFFFFFSSRRRHTRWNCDWSSDVCSSDLPLAALLAFFMVLNFQFASGQLFSASYLRGQSGLVYLLTYPVLFFGRAGTALGVDGLIARGIRRAKPLD